MCLLKEFMDKEYSYYCDDFTVFLENACEKMRMAATFCAKADWPIAIINLEPTYVVGNKAFSSIFIFQEGCEFGASCIISNSPLSLIFQKLANSVITARPTDIEEDIKFSFVQDGLMRERYFKFSYELIKNENKQNAGGIITVVETTEQVLAKRRWRLLEKLTYTNDFRNGKETHDHVIMSLLRDSMPEFLYCSAYVAKNRSNVAELKWHVGSLANGEKFPSELSVELLDDIQQKEPAFDNLQTTSCIFLSELPLSARKKSILTADQSLIDAVVFPLTASKEVFGKSVLLIGILPGKIIDKTYVSFLSLVAEQIGKIIFSESATNYINIESDLPQENLDMVSHGSKFPKPVKIRSDLETNKVDGLDTSLPERVKVLIVDDQPEIVRLMQRLLNASCDVEFADNGLRGLEKARAERPDLVIADMSMPGLTGLELLKAIRSDEAIHTMSVIMVSANSSEEARLACLADGADDYLVKPFKTKEFTARVHSHVKMIRMRREAAKREVELLSKIEQAEHNLETVLENTNETFLMLSPELRVIAINAAGARIVGVRKNALIGRKLGECAVNFYGSVFEQALLETISTRRTIMSEYLHPVSGRWLDLRCYPAEHGVTVFSADITEKKLAAEALINSHAALEIRVDERTQQLRNANKLLGAIFDRAPGGIALFSLDGHYLRANATYQKLLGYTEQELQSNYSSNSFLVPEQYKKKMVLLQKLKFGEIETCEMDAEYILKSNKTIWVSNYFSTIKDDQGNPSYFLKIMQDISERKNSEKQIMRSRKELRELYETLQAVRTEERKSLAREVHDQLGQILTAAKIDIKLLEDDIQNREILPSYPEILTELKSARLTLDNGIQAVRKISTELRPPEVADHGLCTAIKWHVKDFQQRTRIKCSFSVEETKIRERDSVVAVAIFRVFQEAMTNVLRHASAGEVSICLTMRGKNMVLRVLDNGVGITRDRMNAVKSIGIKGMRERVALLNGKIFIGRVRSGGTLLMARVPCGG